jgi:hypothetical protein
LEALKICHWACCKARSFCNTTRFFWKLKQTLLPRALVIEIYHKILQFWTSVF